MATWLTVKEFADKVNAHPQTIRRHIASGKISFKHTEKGTLIALGQAKSFHKHPSGRKPNT